jgi:hypothetical protein
MKTKKDKFNLQLNMAHETINWNDCDFGTAENPQCGICGATGHSLSCGRWDEEGEQIEDTLCYDCVDDYEWNSDNFEYKKKQETQERN